MRVFGYIAIALLIGAASGYYLAPAKIEERVVIQKAKQRNSDVYTITVETVYPDGRVERRTEKVDKSTTLINSIAQKDKKSEQKQYNNLIIRGLFAGNVHTGELTYGLGIDRRLLGPIYLGVWGLANGTLGAALSLSF